jgi:acyl-CoA thioesterase YciA
MHPTPADRRWGRPAELEHSGGKRPGFHRARLGSCAQCRRAGSLDGMSDEQPRGELALRTVTMPADTNSNGDIFGGWIMSQMDSAGGIVAKETARGRVVTVAVESMRFLEPVKVGDVVCCYASLVRVGNTSMTIHLETWVKPVTRDVDHPRFKVTEADFVYVAIDEDGNKRPVRDPR